MTPDDQSRPTRGKLTRRAFLRTAGGTALVAGAVATRGSRSAGTREPFPATPNALGPAVPPEVSRFAADWPTPQGNLAAHRAAADSPIAAANVGRLEVAWRLPLTADGFFGSVTAIPIVVGETVYLQDTESNVFALDRATGAIRWRHDYGALTGGPNGVAVGYGLVFGGTGLNAEAFALDGATGAEVWRVKLTPNPNEFVFMQPLVYDNVVYSAPRRGPTSAARGASSSRSTPRPARRSGSGTRRSTTSGATLA